MDQSSPHLPDFRVDNLFRYFVVAAGRGYACQDMRYEGSEIVLTDACMVTSQGWYSRDDELRFPKEVVRQILPGEWKFGAAVYELGRRVKLVTTGSC